VTLSSRRNLSEGKTRGNTAQILRGPSLPFSGRPPLSPWGCRSLSRTGGPHRRVDLSGSFRAGGGWFAAVVLAARRSSVSRVSGGTGGYILPDMDGRFGVSVDEFLGFFVVNASWFLHYVVRELGDGT
jgi:hypothetical protein